LMQNSSPAEWPLELTYDSRWACCLIAQPFKKWVVGLYMWRIHISETKEKLKTPLASDDAEVTQFMKLKRGQLEWLRSPK